MFDTEDYLEPCNLFDELMAAQAEAAIESDRERRQWRRERSRIKGYHEPYRPVRAVARSAL